MFGWNSQGAGALESDGSMCAGMWVMSTTHMDGMVRLRLLLSVQWMHFYGWVALGGFFWSGWNPTTNCTKCKKPEKMDFRVELTGSTCTGVGWVHVSWHVGDVHYQHGGYLRAPAPPLCAVHAFRRLGVIWATFWHYPVPHITGLKRPENG